MRLVGEMLTDGLGNPKVDDLDEWSSVVQRHQTHWMVLDRDE